jgi:hypothetical protein
MVLEDEPTSHPHTSRRLLLVVLGVLIGLGLIHRRNLSGLAKRLATIAAGVVLLLLPLMARYLTVGAPALGSSSVGAMTFIACNADDVSPQHGFDISRHMADIMGEVTAFVEAGSQPLRFGPPLGETEFKPSKPEVNSCVLRTF